MKHIANYYSIIMKMFWPYFKFNIYIKFIYYKIVNKFLIRSTSAFSQSIEYLPRASLYNIFTSRLPLARWIALVVRIKLVIYDKYWGSPSLYLLWTLPRSFAHVSPFSETSDSLFLRMKCEENLRFCATTEADKSSRREGEMDLSR